MNPRVQVIHEGPFYIAVSATSENGGTVAYRLTTMDRQAAPLGHLLIGSTDRHCGHLDCALAQLSEAALGLAETLGVERRSLEEDGHQLHLF